MRAGLRDGSTRAAALALLLLSITAAGQDDIPGLAEVLEGPPVVYGEAFDTTKIRVCSWNIYRLSASKEATALRDMAAIIARNRCDVISIQEVLGAAPVRAIQAILNAVPNGPRWGRIVSQSTGGAGSQVESYAILWNRETIDYAHQGGLVKGSGMVRAPHAAGFRALAGGNDGFDFILMSIHTKTGYQLGDDLKALRQDMDNLRKANPGEEDILVVGDFNAQPSQSPVSHWDAHLGGLSWALVNPPDTSMAGRDDILNDNVVWGPPTVEDFTGEKGVDPFETSFKNGGSNKRISDHRPVWAMFFVDHDYGD